METLLLQLLQRLDMVGRTHKELYDSEVRERVGIAIMQGFVRAVEDYVIPERFGMDSREADEAVRAAILDYVTSANAQALDLGLCRFHDRLAAVQNPDVHPVLGVEYDYEELLGHTPPELYDDDGNLLRSSGDS